MAFENKYVWLDVMHRFENFNFLLRMGTQSGYFRRSEEQST